jgi:hypothetical protein
MNCSKIRMDAAVSSPKRPNLMLLQELSDGWIGGIQLRLGETAWALRLNFALLGGGGAVLFVQCVTAWSWLLLR